MDSRQERRSRQERGSKEVRGTPVKSGGFRHVRMQQASEVATGKSGGSRKVRRQ